MKPFKYPFPLIFNLPEVIMVICDAPGAALIGKQTILKQIYLFKGINQSEEYIKTDGLLNDYPSCIFVCLDEEKIYMEHDGHHEIPSLESLEKSLLSSYIKINSTLVGTLTDAKKPSNRPHVPKSIKYTGNIEEQRKCLEIIKTFRKKIQEKIIDHIPEVPIYEHKKVKLS